MNKDMFDVAENNRKRLSSVPETNAQVVLCTEGLQKTFGGNKVLKGVSLELRRGEIVLLRGDNGSGKTTLLNILTGNLEPDFGMLRLNANERVEEFRFPRPWWQDLNPIDHFVPERVAKNGVGRTWQEVRLFSTLDLLTNVAVAAPNQRGENPAWAILRHSSVKQQEKEVFVGAQSILLDLGLKDRERSSADMVSLGQAKRVAIARAIQGGAKILFLDEPLAGLDTFGIHEVIRLLTRLARDHSTAFVIVEHVFNISRILELATTVWTLSRGELTVESPEDVRKEVQFTVGNGLRGWLRQLTGIDGKVVDQELPGEGVLSTAIPAGSDSNPPILEVNDLVVHRGGRLVVGTRTSTGLVQGISFTLRKGHLSLLQAPNGWGKTTLFEALAGLLPITKGTIRLNGRPSETFYPWKRTMLGLSFLRARDHIIRSLTVREMLRLAHVAEVPDEMKRVLEEHACDLSGGEQQKLALACATKGRPFSIGLLDEPFSALDPVSVSTLLFYLLKQFSTRALLIAIPRTYELND